MTKPGRPRLPPAERRDHVLQVPLTEDEAWTLRDWSKATGEAMAPLVRGAALRAAKRVR